MNFDKYFAREYNPKTSTCFDLVADFYLGELNIDLRALLPAFAKTGSFHGQSKAFKRVKQGSDLCLCVFKPLNPRIEVAHVGIFWKGDVFHIDCSGVKMSPLSTMALQYKENRFYEVHPQHI